MKTVARLCLIILFLTHFGCAGMGAYSPLFSVERSLIYQTSSVAVAPTDPTDTWFTTDDGVRLHGRFYDHPQRRAVILFCHGNAGSVASWSQAAMELQKLHHCAVFVFDYRGYGQSQGSPSEEGLRHDARAARRCLAEKAGVREQDIVLLGRSLGGGVAVDLAASDGARGLILENTFSSLPDVAEWHVPWLLPHLNMTQRFDSAEKIKHYPGPLLQYHGDADQLIPIALARKLFDAAPGKKRFIVVPHGGHNDPPGDAYHEALEGFLVGLEVK